MFRNSCTSISSETSVKQLFPYTVQTETQNFAQKLQRMYFCAVRCIKSPDFIIFLGSDHVSGVLENITNSNSSAPPINPKVNPTRQPRLGNSVLSCLSHLRKVGQALKELVLAGSVRNIPELDTSEGKRNYQVLITL